MSAAHSYHGSCFCGSVHLEVSGDPVAMGYCHCESCRQWSAAPVNAFTLWQPEALRVTRGIAAIGSYNRTANSSRKWCIQCGSHLYTAHPTLGVIDIYAATIPQLDFEPVVHVHYQETVLRMHDGLPKMKDLPAPMGGSGIEVPE